jgi:hypothetical protein
MVCLVSYRPTEVSFTVAILQFPTAAVCSASSAAVQHCLATALYCALVQLMFHTVPHCLLYHKIFQCALLQQWLWCSRPATASYRGLVQLLLHTILVAATSIC